MEINVTIVENNESIREGLSTLIDGTEGFRCIAKYDNCKSMLNEIMKIKPDVTLIDISSQHTSGIKGIYITKRLLPDVEILGLTVYENIENIFQAICAGASGYITKQTLPLNFIQTIKDAYSNIYTINSLIARKVINLLKTGHYLNIFPNSTLSYNEKIILNELSKGNSYKYISDSLFLSIEEIQFNIRNIYKKLHIHSQSEAVAKAIKKGLI
jgi:DNA-binding NarL/FixJ family response regulator